MRYGPVILGLLVSGTSFGEVFSLNGHQFTVPDGIHVEQIAGTPLVDRPVSADLDERGRLYVTDSSGTNAPAKQQQEERPHRIMRLTDKDGDGIFDDSTVYADKLMFPEGSLWYDGSLYVAAPPEIWKFTDADDDGVAEKREVWFDGKTLTGCANDLHGPYLGPDGWIYWCKGAFAEQTYARAGRSPLVTTASHIFRRLPEGGPVESVMTGGMDNPVELVFTPGGERIITTTFLTHPRNGQRDGLIHAIYGGVYGKDHSVLNGHARTGDLMPVLSHLGAAAPCGLARLQTSTLGDDYRNTVLASSFNLHKVIRHKLTWNGAALDAEISDVIASDNLDFHPTDVLEDADGSVIVVDTGGWFRLCCPTSQLEKADVFGGIYRIRRPGKLRDSDPRGKKIHWTALSAGQLAELISDKRPAVRRRAMKEIGRFGDEAVSALEDTLHSENPETRRNSIWTLTRIPTDSARAAVRSALRDSDAGVKQAALHSISVRRDRQAAAAVTKLLQHAPPQVRRVAAEAMGRIGAPSDVRALLTAVSSAVRISRSGEESVDRVLEHSLIYAAIELNSPEAIRQQIKSQNFKVRRAALIALDQVEDGDLTSAEVAPLLVDENSEIRDAAWWIANNHPDWGDDIAAALKTTVNAPPADPVELTLLGNRLTRFSASATVQNIMAAGLRSHQDNDSLREVLLQAMVSSSVKPMPEKWNQPVVSCLAGKPTIRRAALAVLNRHASKNLSAEADAVLRVMGSDAKEDSEIRLRAMNLIPAPTRHSLPGAVDFACTQMRVTNEITSRSLAVDYLKSTPLNAMELQRVAAELPNTGPLELKPVLTVFSQSKESSVGESLVAALLKSPAATSLFPDQLNTMLKGFGEDVISRSQPLLKRIEEENNSKVERVESILALLPKADIRRGLRVFQSTTASCLACHQRGYIGGRTGPGLNGIGQVRSERDLLESILFPSLSFVRSYEPVSIVTTNGRVFNGLIREETESTITLQLDAKKTQTIEKSMIEEQQAGTVSVMPAGLEKQLSPQDLADLVRYLKEG